MATVSQIVYDVREMLKAYSDDIEISNSYIQYLYGIKILVFLLNFLFSLDQHSPI